MFYSFSTLYYLPPIFTNVKTGGLVILDVKLDAGTDGWVALRLPDPAFPVDAFRFRSLIDVCGQDLGSVPGVLQRLRREHIIAIQQNKQRIGFD